MTVSVLAMVASVASAAASAAAAYLSNNLYLSMRGLVADIRAEASKAEERLQALVDYIQEQEEESESENSSSDEDSDSSDHAQPVCRRRSIPCGDNATSETTEETSQTEA